MFGTNYHIMHKNTPVADVFLSSDHKYIKIDKLVPDGPFQPFGGNKLDLERFYRFIKGRCYEDCRADLPEILASVGLESNDPYKWIRISHGVTWEDFFWVKFDDENIKWEDVKIRD